MNGGNGTLAAVIAGAVGVLLGCGDGAAEGSGYARASKAAVAGLDTALRSAAQMREPYRCATMTSPAKATVRAAGRVLEPKGPALIAKRSERGGDRLVIGALGDARDGDALTMKQIEKAKIAFRKRGVELVLSLGGMGRDREAIARVLGALARAESWLVVAMPGAREALPAHRAAIGAVKAPGLIDGSAVRLIEMDGAVLGLFPGVQHAARLHAGADGCAHGKADAEALARALAERKGVRVWASYAPPRQGRSDGSDVGADGIHVGERVMSGAVLSSKAALVVNSQVDRAAFGRRRGARSATATAPLYLATGPIEAMPITNGRDRMKGSALVITIETRSIRWERIRF